MYESVSFLGILSISLICAHQSAKLPSITANRVAWPPRARTVRRAGAGSVVPILREPHSFTTSQLTTHTSDKATHTDRLSVFLTVWDPTNAKTPGAWTARSRTGPRNESDVATMDVCPYLYVWDPGAVAP